MAAGCFKPMHVLVATGYVELALLFAHLTKQEQVQGGMRVERGLAELRL